MFFFVINVFKAFFNLSAVLPLEIIHDILRLNQINVHSETDGCHNNEVNDSNQPTNTKIT